MYRYSNLSLSLNIFSHSLPPFRNSSVSEADYYVSKEKDSGPVYYCPLPGEYDYN